MSENISKIPVNKFNILRLIEDAWNAFHTYIGSLTEEKLIEPKDAVGWTAKDPIIHISIWEDSLRALLEKRSRSEAMGIDENLWEQDDVDAVNACYADIKAILCGNLLNRPDYRMFQSQAGVENHPPANTTPLQLSKCLIRHCLE